MRWKRLLMATALAAGAAGPAVAQPARTEAQVRADPRDIREVFLAVPLPVVDWADDYFPLDSALATYARRRAVLDQALARGEPNVLDARNGYLRLRLAADPLACDSLELVMTYFNREDGRRLVVMQTLSYPGGGQRSDDHFWTLAPGGRFTPVHWTEVVPEITFRDFWGDRPLPENRSPTFFREMEATHVEWPRQGTTARLQLFTPWLVPGEDEEGYDALVELFESRRFGEMELVWDRRRGVFTKGRKTPYEPEEEHHHH